MKYAKKISRVRKVVKKRYFKGKGLFNPKLNTMARDIARLKSLVNVEKKSLESNVIPYATSPIGQVNLTQAGLFIDDITPLPIQGIGHSQRNGNEIKLVSMCIKGQIRQQVNCTHNGKIKIYIILPQGPQIAMTAITNGQFLETNPLSNVIDYNSSRNVDYFKNYRVLKTLTITMPSDGSSAPTLIKDFSIIMKLSHHIKWADDSNTNFTNGQMILLAVADSGNTGATAVTNTTISQVGALTGYEMQFYTKFYYVDN